jgi:hypothetical protein
MLRIAGLVLSAFDLASVVCARVAADDGIRSDVDDVGRLEIPWLRARVGSRP